MAGFDVGQCLAGLIEREHTIDHGPQRGVFEQWRKPFELLATGVHEMERIVDFVFAGQISRVNRYEFGKRADPPVARAPVDSITRFETAHRGACTLDNAGDVMAKNEGGS